MALQEHQFILSLEKKEINSDMELSTKILCVVIGYLIGCVQTAYVVGKLMHVDLRNHGSGNLGSTNALRVLGKKAGMITFVCDICKTAAAFFICRFLFSNAVAVEPWGLLPGIYACFGVILGHDFPFYLKFKGGKGIASMIGMILCFGISYSYEIMFITFGMGILGLFTRYVSVGSLLFSISIPFAFYIQGFSTDCIVLTGILTVLAVWRHKANMKRLIAGNENKLGGKK